MYSFLHTEQTNDKASEFETKSLLYLFSMRDDSSEIDTFIIDCFNDVTGANNNCDKLWDVQSKGKKSLRPSTIGESLITLFENCISQINFDYYILFFPKLKDIYFIDNDISVFKINNFKKQYISKITEGLQKEYERRNNKCINENAMKKFLNEVNFVVDTNTKSKYVKNIMDLKKYFGKNEEFFECIFNEIRDRQSILKNNSIHQQKIDKVSDVLKFNKHLKRNDIEMLIVDRIIGLDIFNPLCLSVDFLQIIKDYGIEEQRNIIQECNSEICLMLFNNNDKEKFWSFFEKIYLLLKNNTDYTIDEIFEKIENKTIIKKKILSEKSAKYFISLIKEGIKHENT